MIHRSDNRRRTMALKTRRWQRARWRELEFTELGFGSAPLGNLYRAIGDDEAQAILDAAWSGGVRYYDTAPLYGLGLSETRINRFLRGKSRDEYLLSTKVGRLMQPCSEAERTGIGKWFEVPTRREVYDYGYDGIMRSLEFSLERLGVDRIDIIYAHDLCPATHGSRAASDARIEELMSSGYRAMISLREQGVVGAIGGGLNEWDVCQTLAERGDFDLFLLAGRYTLLEQEALETFLPLCESRGTGIVVGGPYNSGVLASGPRPDAFYNYEAAPEPVLAKVRRIQAVCESHDVRMIDAALRFPLLNPSVVTVIPGGQSVEQVHDNLRAAKATIPPALWTDLKAEGLMREDAPTG
jgi:D-threo-aldose 1-dehydrogenase